MTQTTGTTRRGFYKKLLARKIEDLTAIEEQLAETLTNQEEVKLKRKFERLLNEIDEIEANLSELDRTTCNPNISYLSLEKSFQKIDFCEAKGIAQSVNNRFGNASGAVLLFLQKSTKQKGDYCIKEVLDLILSDRKAGEDIYGGDFRAYPVDLDSPISEFNEAEFSKRLASHLSANQEESLHKIIKILCSSLVGGSTVFISVKNWDSLTEHKNFLDWFMEEFWQSLVNEIAPVFRKFSKIRLIVALIAKSQVFVNGSDLPPYFCTEDTFEIGKIIQLPLPDWTVEDIKNWLIIFQNLSDEDSRKIALQIHKESEGTPHTICSILERDFKK